MTQKEEFLTSIKLHQTFLYHARGTRAMHFFYALKMESLPEILFSLDTEILLVLTFQYSRRLKTNVKIRTRNIRKIIYLWVNVTSDRSN